MQTGEEGGGDGIKSESEVEREWGGEVWGGGYIESEVNRGEEVQ